MSTASTLRARIALQLANWAQRLAKPGELKIAEPQQQKRALSAVDGAGRGWWSLLARHVGFQRNTVEVNQDQVVRQPTVFACLTLIANDIGKLRPKLMEQVQRIWTEVTSPAFSPVLRKPNGFQTWQQFVTQWVLSLLTEGNAYVLKVRDARRVVVALYVLDPTRCQPLVSESGAIFYQLQEDDLSGVFQHLPAVPASEVIHDRINCLFHPLVGLSPIFACGLVATKGLQIDENATRFFANQSQPGGILTAPAEISDEVAARLKAYFEEKFTGENAGKVAVLGDGLKYEALTTNAVDAQLIEQLKWSASQIAAVFHVPGYLVGAEGVPPNNNIEALRIDYYSRCLQTLIEGIENSLDAGLGLGAMSDGRVLGIELDLGGLLRMDTTSQVEVLTKASGGAFMKIDEARAAFNLGTVTGGDTIYKQHQDYAIEALAKRDASDDPFGTAQPPAPAPAPGGDDAPAQDDAARAEAAAAKALADSARADVQRLADQMAQVLAGQRERDAEATAAAALEAHSAEMRATLERAASEHAQQLRDVRAMVERLAAPPPRDDAQDALLLAAAVSERLRALPALTDG